MIDIKDWKLKRYILEGYKKKENDTNVLCEEDEGKQRSDFTEVKSKVLFLGNNTCTTKVDTFENT